MKTDTENNKLIESKSLRFSMFGYLFMAILGITFALLTKSEAILLDGVYSLVSFIMAILAGKISQIVFEPDSRLFPFGYAHFEPWLNTLRGILILAICLFALISAITAILSGGRSMNAGFAIIYTGSAALIGIIVALNQNRIAKKVKSPILEVDAKNWLMDGMISFGAGLAFVCAYFIEGTRFDFLYPYVDPVLVSVIVLVMIRMPLTTIRDNFKEIILVAPEYELQDEVTKSIETTIKDLPYKGKSVRMLKTGRYFYVMIHIFLDPDFSVDRLDSLDHIRNDIMKALEKIPQHISVDTIFTSEESCPSINN